MFSLVNFRALLNTLDNPCDTNNQGFRITKLSVPIDGTLHSVLINDVCTTLSDPPKDLETSVSLGLASYDSCTYPCSSDLQHFNEQ